MTDKLRVISLFAGIGGFDLGLERTGGFKTVRLVERKPHARAVLAKNFPGVRCDDDVTTCEYEEGEADVIAAGFPCQDISFAGEGAGLSGSRSGLYREVIRAVRVVRPLYAVLENVAALLSRGLGTVLGDLASIGYDAEWHCIPASAVGAPHRRDRVWIVANPGGEQHEGGCAPLSGSLATQLSGSMADTPGYGWAGSWPSDEGRNSYSSSGDGIRAQSAGNGAGAGTEYLAHATRELRNGRWWATEPNVGRVAHGVPQRVDRLEELGNAVVPQIPEIIGNAILQARAA